MPSDELLRHGEADPFLPTQGVHHVVRVCVEPQVAQPDQVSILALDPPDLAFVAVVGVEELPDDRAACLRLAVPVYEAVRGQALHMEDGPRDLRVDPMCEHFVQWIGQVERAEIPRRHPQSFRCSVCGATGEIYLRRLTRGAPWSLYLKAARSGVL